MLFFLNQIGHFYNKTFIIHDLIEYTSLTLIITNYQTLTLRVKINSFYTRFKQLLRLFENEYILHNKNKYYK